MGYFKINTFQLKNLGKVGKVYLYNFYILYKAEIGGELN